MIPGKGKWMLQDLKRTARIYQVPIKLMPEIGFPVNTLLAMRLLTAIRTAPAPLAEYIDCVNRIYVSQYTTYVNLLMMIYQVRLLDGRKRRSGGGSFERSTSNKPMVPQKCKRTFRTSTIPRS